MKLPRRLWIPIAAVGVGFFAVANADGPEETVLAAADTWISQSPPHANHSVERTLGVGAPGGARALVRLATPDLAAAVAGRPLVSARLELTIEGQDRHWGRDDEHGVDHRDAWTVDVHRVATAWTESGATWLAPAEPGPRPRQTWSMGPGGRDQERPWTTPPTASLFVERGRTGVLSFDVTTDVASFVVGTAPNFGWILKRRDEERSGRLDLRARESSSPPRLVLTFGVGAAAIGLVSGDGQRARPGESLPEPLVVAVRDASGRGLPGQPIQFAVVAGDASLVGPALSYTDANGIARATVGVGASAAAASVVRVSATAQGLPGAQPVSFRAIVLPPPLVLSAVADTYVSRIRPNEAHGSESVLRVGAIGRRRALVRFESQQLAALLAGAELDRAELELAIAAPVQRPHGGPSRTFEVGAHRILTPWTELGATWNSPADARPANKRRDGPRWSMGRPPLPFLAQPTSTVTLEPGQTGAARLDVTADLRAFLSGSTPNEGWLVKSVREHGPGQVDFLSRETSTPPRLVVYLRDVTPPSISFTEPDEGAFVGLGGTVVATFSDPSGVVVESFSSSVGGVDVTQTFSTSVGEARATVAQLAPTLAQGPNTFTASVEDSFGNTGTATRTFVFDSVPPTVSLEPADGAIVVSASLVIRLAASDAGSGVEPAAVSLTVNGSPVAIQREDGVGVVDLAVPAGDYVLVATVDDRAGNRTQVTSSIRLTPRGIRGQILGGKSPDDVLPVAGVRVRALDGPPVETHTDANGEFTLYGSPVGRVGVIADGFLVGFGRTNFLADVVDGAVTPLVKPIVVPPVAEDDGVEVVLDGEGRTTSELVVTSRDSLSAELRIAAGSRIVLPDDGFLLPPGRPLRISIHRLACTFEPEPLPAAPDGQYVSPGVYSIQPAGLEIVEGYTLTLANEAGVAAGETTPLFLFSQRTGTWELKAQMVAAPDELTVTGTLHSLIGIVELALVDRSSQSDRDRVGLYPAQLVYGGPRRIWFFNPTLVTRISVSAGGAICFTSGNPGLFEQLVVGASSGVTERTLGFHSAEDGVVPDGLVGFQLNSARGDRIVYLDRTPPSGVISAPLGSFEGSRLFARSSRLNVLATDQTAGVHRVIFQQRTDGTNWPPQYYENGPGNTNVAPYGWLGPRVVNVDNREVAELLSGDYHLRVVLIDTANNVTFSPGEKGFPVTIDRVPPVWIDPVSFQQPSLRKTAAVVDYRVRDGVNLATVELVRDGVSVVDSRTVPVGATQANDKFAFFTYGRHRYKVRVTDQAGNFTESSEQAYIFDDRRPTVVSVTPSPAQLATLGPITVQVKASDELAGLASFDLARARLGSSNFTPIAVAVPFPGNPVDTVTTVTATDPAVPSDGRWVYRATVRDTLEQAAIVEQQGDVLVDTTPPTIDVTLAGSGATVDGAILAAGPHTFVVALEDLVGVDPGSLRVLLDGAALPFVSAPTTIDVGPELRRTTASATVVRVLEGPHELRVEGQDLLGHPVFYVGHFTQDHRPPTIDSLVVTPTSPTSSATLGLTATYHDDFGVDPSQTLLVLRATAPSGVVTTTDVTAQATITASNLSWSGAVPDGQYDLVLTVTDLSGRQRTQASSSVRVDTQDPTLTLSAPPASPALSVDPRPALTASFSDSGLAGIAPQDVHLFVDGVEVTSSATVTASGATFRPAAALGDGDHSFSAVVTDGAGNGATASTTFRLDATPPTRPGKPLAGPRPFEPTTTIRWFASVDTGSGVAKYRVLRSEDGTTFGLVTETVATELTLPSPTGEQTTFRVVAVDGVGNVSQPAEVLGCELVGLDDLEAPVTTTLVIEVRRTDGTPVTDAVASERGSGVALSHAGLGVYRSSQVTVRAGTPLNLDVLVDGEAFVSGPLLPLLPQVGLTDFGTIVVAHRRLLNDVFGIGARNPPPAGQPGLGATAGEAGAVGPPALTDGGLSLSGGFWQTIDVEGDAVVSVLQVPPVLCGRWVPVYFEVVADETLVDVVAQHSLDNGLTWSTMTIDGATGVASLPGTPLGRRHVLLWDAGTDTAAVSIGDALLRLYPQGRPERGDTISTTVLRSFAVERVTPPSKTLDVDPSTRFELLLTHAPTSDVANLTSSITLVDAGSGAAIPLAFSVTDRTVVATPQALLVARQELALRVAPGLQAAGGPRVFDQLPRHGGLDAFEAAFRVGGQDVTPPSLASSVPADGSGSNTTSTPIVLTFDEDLDPASISQSTVAITSNVGAEQASVVFLPDGRSLLVQPSTPLETDRCYTVSVGPGLRDLAGNALARVEHVTFTTVTTSPMTAPQPPVITQPPDGFTITTASTAPVTTTVSGTSAANTWVRYYVNGFPTDVIAQVDSSGHFSAQSPNLFEGRNELVAVASTVAADSAPSASVAGVVSTNRLGGTPPPAPGQPTLSEVVAGEGSESYYRRVVSFTGPPGGPVTLRIDNTGLSDGFDRPAECTVPAANGGGTYTLIPGAQVIGGLYYDAQGNFTAELGGFQVVGTGAVVSLVDPVTGIETAQHEVQAVAPVSIFDLTGVSTSLATIPGNLATAVRLRDGGAYDVRPVGGYPVRLKAVDEYGNPTDAVRINGQPGSTGAVLMTDASGALPFTLEVVDREGAFRIVACAEGAYEDFPALERLFLGESELFTPEDYVHSSVVTGYFVMDPPRSSSEGGTTRKSTQGCPPDDPASVPDPATTGGPESKPVLLHNGGERLTVVDLAIPSSRGPSFVFARTYKSFVLYAGPLGHRWTHGYDQRLTPGPAGVTWLTGTDRAETFADVGGGSYGTPTGFFNRLTISNGVGTIREADGTRLVFRSFTAASAPGKLDRIVDRHGNALRLEYGTTGSSLHQLTAVIDPLERKVELFHDAFGRIRELRDFLGRSVLYEYGTYGDLIRVTSPVALTTTQGEPLLPAQQFPHGRQQLYGYTRGYADERANHLLTHVVAPAEAVALRDAPRAALEDPAVLTPLARVQNTYGLDPDSYLYTRVVTQRLGGSTQLPAWTGQATPEAAGGTIRFHYEPLPVPIGASLNHPVQKTTLVDRNGNLAEYFHNQAGQCVRLREHANRRLRPRSAGPAPGYGEDPEFFERTWVFNRDGLPLAIAHPSGSTWRWVYGDEDLNGDGLLTAGEDRNGDGDQDDPEDVQGEDALPFAFAPGNGALDRLPRHGQLNLLRSEDVPDARGDTRGGRRPRVWTFSYEPVYNAARSVTNPCGNDPTYTPQNGGALDPARYTTTRFFDYQQGPEALVKPLLAQELGVSEAELTDLLAQAGVQLGRGDLNDSVVDDGRIAGDVVRVEAPSVTLVPEQTLLRSVHGVTLAVVSLMEHNVFGQVTRLTDPEHNLHRFEYHPENDPNGDGVLDSALTEPTGGYVKATITDDSAADPRRNTGSSAPAVQVVSQVFQDAVGNPVRAIDPRGVEHVTQWSPLNEVVRVRAASRIAGPPPGEPQAAVVALDYEALVFHDLNGRVVEVRGENAGERDGTATTVASNPYWTRKLAYNVLDDVVLTLAEVEPLAVDDAITTGSPGVIVARVSYDSNQNVQLVTKPEGNQTAFVWDERDLLFQATDGFGSADAAAVTFHHTINGTPQLTVDAVKHNPNKLLTMRRIRLNPAA